jgi:hypothetical protein
MNDDDLPLLQLLFNEAEVPPQPLPPQPLPPQPQPLPPQPLPTPIIPLAAQPFRVANFQFASTHNVTIGSLYFADAGGHQRIRLVHGGGPRIGGYHPRGEWYFPPVGVDFPIAGASTADIDLWIANGAGPVIPNAPVVGNQVIEYAADHIDSAGRHVSRGVVSMPVITQHDIDVLYNLIINGADNDALTQGILDNNLSPVLRQ